MASIKGYEQFAIPSPHPTTIYDRRRSLVIDDDPYLGKDVFIASDNAGDTAGNRLGQRKTTAIIVREPGTENFCRILRLMYTVPSSVQDNLNT